MNQPGHVLCIFFIILLSACAPPTARREAAPPVEIKSAVPVEEQKAKALKLFNQILHVSRSSDDRQALLPEIERLYMKIINESPDAPLAQESYLKLMEIYVREYSPPQFDKAGAFYEEFITKYPESVFKGVVDRTLGVSYYQNREWNRLLSVATPAFRAYTEEGKHQTALMIFMYAEASFQLGDFEEAEKGFRIVMEEFPELNENERARARIDYIRRSRSPAQ